MISPEFAKLFVESLAKLTKAGYNIKVPFNMTMKFMKSIILLASKLK